MGASRICPRCHVRLVTDAAHTRIWCPVCKREIRVVHHDEESQPPPRRPSGSAPPPPPPPPVVPPTPAPKPSVLVAEPYAPPIIVPHHRPARHPRAVLLLTLFLTLGIVGGGVALVVYLAGPEEETAPVRPNEPSASPSAPVATAKTAQRISAPGTAHLTYEQRQQKAVHAIFQQEGKSPPAGAPIPEGAKRIDELVQARLQAKGIPQAPLCSDAVFLRRVYLDVIGRIPTLEEARAFLDDPNPNRRVALIDTLLAHRDFADYWTMKWCDILRVKSEFPVNLWPNAVQAYHRWIRSALRDNVPYDQFARTLLTASGSNFRDPPANFYRAVQKKDATNLARAVALTFMGVRPEGWPRERWAGLEPFFAQVGYKKTGEWKEEVVFFDRSKPLSGKEAIFPDETRATLEDDRDPRVVFANWLITPENPWFTRNICNRAWSWLMGRGIIHEVDDIRPDNLPSNPELLAFLQEEMIRGKYDLKHLFRSILNSSTYQASSIPASEHAEAAALFAFYPVRRLEAEVLIDAICQVTGTTEKYSSPIPEPFTYIPESHRSVCLADASITSPFLEMFGRSSRDTGLESERNNNFNSAQRLHLLNSAHIHKKIDSGPGIQELVRAGGGPEAVTERLYLAILSRYPTKDERGLLADYRAVGGDRRPALDVAWALMNTAEFLCRH